MNAFAMDDGEKSNRRLRRSRSDSRPFHTHGDGALQKGNRNDQTASTFDLRKDSLDIPKRPLLNDEALPNFQKRPGLHEMSRCDHALQCSDFAFVNGLRNPARPDHMHDVRRHQNRQSFLGIEAAKHITREERNMLSLLYGPTNAVYGGIERQEGDESFVVQRRLRIWFTVRLDSEDVPRMVRVRPWSVTVSTSS